MNPYYLSLLDTNDEVQVKIPSRYYEQEYTINTDRIPNQIIKVKNYGKYAKLFKFQGDTISYLCKHNSRVAKENGLDDLAQTWEQLDQIYKEFSKSREAAKLDNKQKVIGASRTPAARNSAVNIMSINNLKVDTKRQAFHPEQEFNLVPKQTQNFNAKSKEKKYGMKFINLEKDYKVISAFDIDHVSILEDTGSSHNASHRENKQKSPAHKHKKTTKAKMMKISLSSAVVRSQKAVNKRHKEVKITHLQTNDIEEEYHCKNEYEHKDSCFEWINDFYKQTIIDIIFSYAEKGDVQSSAIMLLVFKSRIPFPNQRISSVIRLYISLLNRIECTCLATEVIKFCQIADIQNEYEKNTGISTKCQYCKNKESGKDIKWYLDKCGKFNSHCSICDIPVRGRFWWCQHWGHGGHAHHMKKWYSYSNVWPTGCGHQWLDENAYHKVFF